MKILVFQTLLIVAVVTCDVICDDDSDVEITSPQYSRRLEDDYKTYTVSEPVVKTPRTSSSPSPKSVKILRNDSTPKAVKPSPTPPFIRRLIEDIGPVAYKTHTYSVPRRVVQTPSVRVVSSNDDADDNLSPDLGNLDDSQPDDYPNDTPTSQPITVYNVYPVISNSRERPRPRSYRRLSPYRGVQPIYRNIQYGDRATYTIRRIPSTRRFATPVESLRYQPPIEAVRYTPIVNLLDDDIDYDEYAKKK